MRIQFEMTAKNQFEHIILFWQFLLSLSENHWLPGAERGLLRTYLKNRLVTNRVCLMWLHLSWWTKRLGSLVAILAGPTKPKLGLRFFSLMHPQKKCKNL
jgi:hypothetical protein